MATVYKAVPILDTVAESLEACSPRLSAEADAISYALRRVHAYNHNLELYLGDGQDHRWPEPPGDWDIGDIGRPAKYGEIDEVSYQHTNLYIVVDFKAPGEGEESKRKPGTWEMEIAGKTFKGTWKNESDLLKVLPKLEAQAKAMLGAFNRQLRKELAVDGWTVLSAQSGSNIELQRTSKFDKSQEYPASATLWAPLDLFLSRGGKGLADLNLDLGDYGGYGRQEIKNQDVKVMNVAEVKKHLKNWAKMQDRYVQKATASVVLDEVAEALEARGAYGLAALTDHVKEVNHGIRTPGENCPGFWDLTSRS